MSSNWDDIEAQCDCPDWAMPCKHIAAVIYLVCTEIDKNPFVVFDIHDCNLLELIDDFKEGKLTNAQKILQIEDILQRPDADMVENTNQLALDEINLSKIPNLLSPIKNILRDDPAFYDKNFREILHLAYTHWQKYPQVKIEQYFGLAPNLLKSDKKVKSKQTLSAEEIFMQKWQRPDKWDDLTLVINDQHKLVKLYNDDTELFNDATNPILRLVQFLQEIPNEILHKLNYNLRFIYVIYQFTVKLIERSGVIPQILQNNKAEILIRWIPALFDQEIEQIYNKLCSICPKGLVRYNKTNINFAQQVKVAIALIASALIHDNLPAKIEKYKYSHNRRETLLIPNQIFQLFFCGQAYKFLAFGDKELPPAINIWLSSLYLADREHKLYLMVEDENDQFAMDLQVAVNNKDAPITIAKALKIQESQTKLAILSDLSLISEYIPEISRTIDMGEKIAFNLDDFSSLFLNILPALKAIGIHVVLPKSLQKMLKPQLNLKLNSKDKADYDRKSFLNLENLLSFDWKITIGNHNLTIEQFKKLLKESRGLIKFIDQYVLLDEKEMESLLKQIDKLPEHLSNADLMQGILAQGFAGANVEIDQQLKTLFEQLTTYKQVTVPRSLTATLRPYQERGFNWLVQNIDTGFGSILADDMGLGKTLQVITAILHMKNIGYLENNPVLIVAPTSLLSNWQKEIARFAPDLRSLVYHGQNRELKTTGTVGYDVLITSYGLARRDSKELNKIKWFLFVIDEAQNIKNPNSEQTKAIKSINAKAKIAMSGTPIENRLLEYWSIFDFTNKNYLGTPKQFKDKYATPIEKDLNKDNLERFKKITSPFIMRRIKSDKNIIKDLPDKIENNRYCSLTPEQTALYQEVVNMSLDKIDKSDSIDRKGLIFKLINALKQICNHPAQFGKKKTARIEQAGKMQMLEEILLEIDNVGEKALIFTQYTEMGDIISKLLEEKFNNKIPFLHGGLSLKARDEVVYNFQNHSSNRTLIVSLKAGGTGLNLTAAQHVIHYDLWWNPAVEAQATDRAYRIGQTKNVMVYRFLTTGTFEERIDDLINSKKDLANIVVNNSESFLTEMSSEKLKDLISLRNQ